MTPTFHLGTTAAGAALRLPGDAVTQTIAVLARRGQGKTYMARGLAEEMGRSGAQFVVLDPVDHWWGAAGRHRRRRPYLRDLLHPAAEPGGQAALRGRLL